MAENTIQWDQDADGIVTLTLDDPTGSANVMNEHYKESMHNAVERLVAEKDSITGVVRSESDHALQVTTGEEGLLRAGDDHTGDRILLSDKAFDGVVHRLAVVLVHHVGRARRVVQRQGDDAVGILVPLDRVLCHGLKPSR